MAVQLNELLPSELLSWIFKSFPNRELIYLRRICSIWNNLIIENHLKSDFWGKACTKNHLALRFYEIPSYSIFKERRQAFENFLSDIKENKSTPEAVDKKFIEGLLDTKELPKGWERGRWKASPIFIGEYVVMFFFLYGRNPPSFIEEIKTGRIKIINLKNPKIRFISENWYYEGLNDFNFKKKALFHRLGDFHIIINLPNSIKIISLHDGEVKATLAIEGGVDKISGDEDVMYILSKKNEVFKYEWNKRGEVTKLLNLEGQTTSNNKRVRAFWAQGSVLCIGLQSIQSSTNNIDRFFFWNFSQSSTYKEFPNNSIAGETQFKISGEYLFITEKKKSKDAKFLERTKMSSPGTILINLVSGRFANFTPKITPTGDIERLRNRYIITSIEDKVTVYDQSSEKNDSWSMYITTDTPQLKLKKMGPYLFGLQSKTGKVFQINYAESKIIPLCSFLMGNRFVGVQELHAGLVIKSKSVIRDTFWFQLALEGSKIMNAK